MPKNDLYDFMVRASGKMQAEYERIQRRVREDPGTAGDQGEENWAELLRGWLPATMHVCTKGKIMNEQGETSGQVDVLVLDASYPRELLTTKVFLAGGVVAAFECKTTLRSEHIRSAFSNSIRITSLLSPRSGSPYSELHRPLVYGLLAHSHEWKQQGSAPIDNITRTVVEEHEKLSHPREMVDCICVSDVGSWTARKQALVGTYMLEKEGLRWEKPPGDRVAFTAYLFHRASVMHQESDFTNIGVMISDLLVRLSREHGELRKIAQYFSAVGLGGNASGRVRQWTLPAIYSPNVFLKLSTSETPCSRELWDDWNSSFP
jgi:hypothetical protein